MVVDFNIKKKVEIIIIYFFNNVFLAIELLIIIKIIFLYNKIILVNININFIFLNMFFIELFIIILIIIINIIFIFKLGFINLRDI